jgi:hypothetical protein
VNLENCIRFSATKKFLFFREAVKKIEDFFWAAELCSAGFFDQSLKNS